MPGGTRKGRLLRVVSGMTVPAPDGWAATYDRQLMVCRGEQHDFPFGTSEDHYQDVRGPRGKLLEYRREIDCRRCGVTKVDVYEPNGNQRSWMKNYPPGYRISRDEFGYVGRREARAARIALQFLEVRRAGGA